MLPSNPICAVCDYGTSATYRDLPSDEQLRNGVVPLDSLPAAWWNCMWNMTNHSINQARSAVGVLINEINTVLEQAGVCACDVCVDQLYKAIDNISQTIGNAVRAGAVKSSACCGQVSIDNNGIMTANGLGNAACLTTTAQNAIGAINELKSTYDSCWTANATALDGKAPTSHASSANTYGVGSAANYGHLKISDTYTSVLAACSGVAASQQAVTCVYCYAAGIAAAALGLGNTAGCALGTASAGTATTAARSDHVHPIPTCVPYAVTGGYLGERAALGCAPNCTYGIANIWNYCNDSRYYLIGTKYDNAACKYNVRVDHATSAGSACCASCNSSGVAFGSAATCAASAFLGASGCATDSAKLNGHGSSADNTVNCIVRRDNSGYIYVTKVVTPRIDSVKPTGSATSSSTKLWAWASANAAIDVACVSGNGLLYQRVWSLNTNSAFKIPFMNLTGAQTVSTCSDLTYFAVDSENTFTYNPSTNTLTAGTFSGCATDSAKLTGKAPSALCVACAGKNGSGVAFGSAATCAALVLMQGGNGGGISNTIGSNANKAASVPGFTLYTGATVKIMFPYGNTVASPTLNVNSTGAIPIKIVINGSKVAPPLFSGKWRGGSTASSEMWQSYTVLELIYDGTDWVIIGNPIVESYSTATTGYRIYADGEKEQWLRNGASKGTFTFPIPFSNVPTVVGNSSRAHTYWSVVGTTACSTSMYQEDGGGTTDFMARGV